MNPIPKHLLKSYTGVGELFPHLSKLPKEYTKAISTVELGKYKPTILHYSEDQPKHNSEQDERRKKYQIFIENDHTKIGRDDGVETPMPPSKYEYDLDSISSDHIKKKKKKIPINIHQYDNVIEPIAYYRDYAHYQKLYTKSKRKRTKRSVSVPSTQNNHTNTLFNTSKIHQYDSPHSSRDHHEPRTHTSLGVVRQKKVKKKRTLHIKKRRQQQKTDEIATTIEVNPLQPAPLLLTDSQWKKSDRLPSAVSPKTSRFSISVHKRDPYRQKTKTAPAYNRYNLHDSYHHALYSSIHYNHDKPPASPTMDHPLDLDGDQAFNLNELKSIYSSHQKVLSPVPGQRDPYVITETGSTYLKKRGKSNDEHHQQEEEKHDFMRRSHSSIGYSRFTNQPKRHSRKKKRSRNRRRHHGTAAVTPSLVEDNQQQLSSNEYWAFQEDQNVPIDKLSKSLLGDTKHIWCD